nr:hypothetical protein [Tanacetum cinerariifolium]
MAATTIRSPRQDTDGLVFITTIETHHSLTPNYIYKQRVRHTNVDVLARPEPYCYLLSAAYTVPKACGIN